MTIQVIGIQAISIRAITIQAIAVQALTTKAIHMHLVVRVFDNETARPQQFQPVRRCELSDLAASVPHRPNPLAHEKEAA